MKNAKRRALIAMARRTQTSLRTGWYYSDIEPGEVSAGDALRVVHRANHAWPLSRPLHLFYVDCPDVDALTGVAKIPEMSGSWRGVAKKRLEKVAIDDLVVTARNSIEVTIDEKLCHSQRRDRDLLRS